MKIEHIDNAITSIKTDIMAFGHFKDDVELDSRLAEIDAAMDGDIKTLLVQNTSIGEFKKVTIIYPFGRLSVKCLLIIGLGKKEEFNENIAMEVAGLIIKTAKQLEMKNVVTYLCNMIKINNDIERIVHCYVEGSLLGDYKFKGYAKLEEKENKIENMQLLAYCDKKEIIKGLELGKAYALGTYIARDLINIPGNLMTPTDLAMKAIEIADKYKMKYEVLEKKDMEKLGMGGILAVAQGSDQPPKMIVLKYFNDKNSDNIIGLVGKGLTFDSGGISIKPSNNMHIMKSDMGGGATVLGVMASIAELKLETNVIAVIPSTENLLSGSAVKPGDVITTMSGKTVEVLNTDAEGRLILSDAITYAKELKATSIIDIATLTGAIVVALGDITTGAMTNHQEFIDEFFKSAKIANENVWQLPIFSEYKELIKSDIADLKNTGGRTAGSITAALFLEAFAGETPWIHLDIAGTSWSEKETNLVKKGATGSMVRSLIQYIRDKNISK